MKKVLTRLWRIWFYILAAVPVPILFPFLAIALLFPKGYTFVFWVARNIWAPIILGGSGFYTKIRYAKPLPKGTSYVLVANHTSTFRASFETGFSPIGACRSHRRRWSGGSL